MTRDRVDVREALTRQRARTLALAGLVVFFGLWCVLTYGGFVPAMILPSPTDVCGPSPCSTSRRRSSGARAGASIA